MTSHVYTLHSTLELPLEDVYEFFEDPTLPVEIDDIDITRRNNTLILRAIAAENNISKYTPTAQLKASVTENRVYLDEGEEEEEDDGPFGTAGPSGGPQWTAFGEEEEEERPSELVEYACFKGDRETVLQNTALQYPMFEVLRSLALECEKGTLTAIAAVDDELRAFRIVDGEERAATVDVVEDPRENESADAVNWRDNKFIS